MSITINQAAIRKITLITAVLIAAIVAGCATTNSKPPALVQVVRNQKTEFIDCAVSVNVFNQMSGTAWTGVSLHVILRDRNNAPIGEIQEIPMRYTEPGYGITFQSKIQGVKCNEIAGLSILYFGYYPADGGGQLRFRNEVVATELK